MGWEAARRETIMKSGQMGILLVLSVGMAQAVAQAVAQAAQPERARLSSAPTLQIREASVAARPPTSPARKAEKTRRLFWLAMSLR